MNNVIFGPIMWLLLRLGVPPNMIPPPVKRVDRDAEFVLKIIVISGIFLTAMILTTAARSHEWFDRECCSDLDCRIAKDGEVRTLHEGVEVQALGVRERVPYTDPRVRVTRDPENRPAFCVRPQIYGSGPRLQCVYVPAGGA